MVKRLPTCILFLLLTAFTQAQVTYNGNMTEGYWSFPLGTAASGPASCQGTGNVINSLYAAGNDTELLLGIGADVSYGHHILIFIDSKIGGYNNAGFSHVGAPLGLTNFNAGIQFDNNFYPDYCLVLGTNTDHDNFTFDLFPLDGTGGSNIRLGTAKPNNPTIGAAYKLSADPSNNDFTKGFEIAIPQTVMGYIPLNQQQVKLMVMGISDAGNINNQFISKANTGEGCYGSGAIDFKNFAPDPVEYNPSKSLPIDFVNIAIRQVAQDIKVIWKSASEKEMKEYQVERSSDAIVFTNIGTVMAKGNATGITEYDFTDKQPIIGKSFYRIKAMDKTGRTTYSSIAKINYGRVDNTLIIFPNPVVDQINLQIVGIKDGTYILEIFNDLGQKLITKNIVYNGGYGLQQIPLLSSMRKGPYRLLLRNKAVFYKQHFLVQ